MTDVSRVQVGPVVWEVSVVVPPSSGLTRLVGSLEGGTGGVDHEGLSKSRGRVGPSVRAERGVLWSYPVEEIYDTGRSESIQLLLRRPPPQDCVLTPCPVLSLRLRDSPSPSPDAPGRDRPVSPLWTCTHLPHHPCVPFYRELMWGFQHEIFFFSVYFRVLCLLCFTSLLFFLDRF